MFNALEACRIVEDEMTSIYQALQCGKDVSPGRQLRLEGKVDLLLQLNIIDWNWLQQLVNRQYEQYFSQRLLPDYWQWMQAEERFILPIKMWDAPVYKNR